MYKCLNCRERFEKPFYEREIHYECDENPYELILVCPFCRDMDIEREEKINE